MTKNRFRNGFALLLLVLVLGFAVANAAIPNWGSAPEEVALALPGDDIFPDPVLRWQHAVTIDAAPEEVWAWLAQMGDTRGGYYSYRYIEKAITALAGVDVSSYYPNTNTVRPEWQNPTVGQPMLMDILVVRQIEPGQTLVAGPAPELSDGGLLWTWSVTSTADGRARLLVHMRIQIPGMGGNKLVEAALNLSTFMMERKMVDGIKLRAEGGTEPDWYQAAEAVLWFAALGVGIAAARRYLKSDRWQLPLAAALAAVVLLFVFTYLQPALWLRFVAVVGIGLSLRMEEFTTETAEQEVPTRSTEGARREEGVKSS